MTFSLIDVQVFSVRRKCLVLVSFGNCLLIISYFRFQYIYSCSIWELTIILRTWKYNFEIENKYNFLLWLVSYVKKYNRGGECFYLLKPTVLKDMRLVSSSCRNKKKKKMLYYQVYNNTNSVWVMWQVKECQMYCSTPWGVMLWKSTSFIYQSYRYNWNVRCGKF